FVIMDIRSANPDRHDLNQHFTGAGFGNGHFFHTHIMDRMQNGRLHFMGNLECGHPIPPPFRDEFTLPVRKSASFYLPKIICCNSEDLASSLIKSGMTANGASTRIRCPPSCLAPV